MIMTTLVFLSATSFWDTAAPDLSSRLSISLTIILTLAAYTSNRAGPIERTPALNFQENQDRCGVGFCFSRKIDCEFLIIFLILAAVCFLHQFYSVYHRRWESTQEIR